MPRKSTDVPYIFFSTAPTQKEAHTLAKELVQKKIAACVNVLPGATSFFYWKGKEEVAREEVLIIKTTENKISELKNFFAKNHSYEVPELIGWKIEQGSMPYLAWVINSVR